MRTKLITTIIISFLFCLISTGIKAQDGNVINFMQMVPQSNYNNPAAIPSVGFYFGLPALSALNFGINNGSFSYNNVFSRRADDSLIIDVDKFLGSIKDDNKVSYDVSEQILALGLKVKRSYFTFSVSNKNTINANFTKDFMTFLLKGNEPFIGKSANLGDFKFGLNSYVEAAFGLTREINKRLSVGVRFKYLIGLVNVYTERSSINLYTNPSSYELALTSDVLIKSSTVLDTFKFNNNDKWQSISDLSNKVFNSPNHGMAIDFGGEYKITNKFSVGVSVLDLGYIDWGNDVKNYQSKKANTTINFNGLDINTAFKNGSFDKSVFDDIIDSLKNTMGIDTVNGTKYRAPLKTKIYVSASYFLTKRSRLGLVLRNDLVNQAVNSSFTISYNRYVGKNLSFTFANTIVAGNLLNPGGGISLNLGFAQFYLLVDHSSSFYAADIKNFGFQFGLNLVAGKTKPGQKSTEPIYKEDEDSRKSKKNKLVNEPLKVDSVIVKPPVIVTPIKELPQINVDSAKLLDSLNKIKEMENAIKMKNDSLNKIPVPGDTTSINNQQPLDSVPTINKPEGTTPTNPTPDKTPINNDANKNQPGSVPNENVPKQSK